LRQAHHGFQGAQVSGAQIGGDGQTDADRRHARDGHDGGCGRSLLETHWSLQQEWIGAYRTNAGGGRWFRELKVPLPLYALKGMHHPQSVVLVASLNQSPRGN
jgi:hypothetical protein